MEENYSKYKAMNGFVLKAYKNLYTKGKQLDTSKIKKSTKKEKLVTEDLYEHIYFHKKKPETPNIIFDKSYHPFLTGEGFE